jgi:hypothetical protein
MSESHLPVLPSTVMEKVQSNFPSIMKGNALGIKLLKEVQTTPIKTDEEKQVAIEKLTKVKAIVDKVDLLTKEVTEPIESFLDQVKSFKKAIDYANKTKDGNEYTKARAVIEKYDIDKAAADAKVKYEAELLRQKNLLKAEIKEGVGKRLIDMLAGQQKNIIDGMSRWEQALTLENINSSYEKLANQKPALKIDKWEACFGLNFMSPNKTAMTPDETVLYMEALKKEFPYDEFNKTYVEAVSPIINEYRAKQEQVRTKLTEIKNAGEAEKIRLEEERKKELETKAAEARKEIDAAATEAHDSVEHQKEMDTMNAEFTAQAQTQDLEQGPMKKIASFESNDNFLKPFAEVIGACVLHPKFPGIMKKNGTDVIDAVQWWLDWYADHTEVKAIKGIKIKEIPKTIIRKK